MSSLQWSAVTVLASSGFQTLDPWPEVGSTKISVMRMLWCIYGTGQQEGAINYMGKGRYLYSLEYIPLVFIVVAQDVVSLLWQLKVSIDLQQEKWKLAFISVLLQIFWQKFYRNVPGLVLYQPYEFCQNHWFWLVAMATERLNFWKKKFKNLLLRSCKGAEAETLHKCLWH